MMPYAAVDDFFATRAASVVAAVQWKMPLPQRLNSQAQRMIKAITMPAVKIIPVAMNESSLDIRFK